MSATRRVLSFLAVAGLVTVAGEAQPSSATAGQDLIDAVRSGDTEAARDLVAQGADVNATQPDGATALHWAAYHDDPDTAARLLRAGANANATNELGATPLWLACTNGSAAMVGHLLENGADPNGALPKGETPLMTAARTGLVEPIELLLAHGADVNARESARGQTALMWAVAQRHHEAAQALIDHGADLHARSDAHPRLIYTKSMNGTIFDEGVIETQGGFTPLLFAARNGDVGSARLLLAAGANVNDTAPNGASALVIAAHSNHAAFAGFLLEHGALPNTHGAGYTALHAAVLRGSLPAVETLLAHGADPNMPFTRGTQVRRTSRDWALMTPWVGATPLWLAAQFREPEIMRALGAASAVTRRADNGTTPLMAATSGDSRRGRGFLEPVEDPVAEERRALDAAKAAVALGSDVHATAPSGNTALHTAAAGQLNSVVEYLVAIGVPVDVENSRGQTPLAMAMMSENRNQIVNLKDNRPSDTEPTSTLLRRLGATSPEDTSPQQ